MTLSRPFFGNANTIYDCCKFVCHIQFVLGCSGIIKQNDNYKCNRKSLFYTWFALLWFMFSLAGTMFIKLQDPCIYKLDSLIKSIIYLEIAMSVFMCLATVLTMLSNITTHLKLYRRLNDLDKKLVKQFSCKLNYEKLVKKNIILLSSGSIIYLTVVVAAVLQASHGQEFIVNLFAGLAYTAITAGPHLNGYAQMNMAEILSIRFRLLQKLLRKRVICCSSLNAKQQITNLRYLIDMVQEYHNCIHSINKVFSVGLVSTMLHDFTLTTSELYLIFGGSVTGNSTSNSLICYVALCMLLPLYKMTIAPIYCDRAIKEGLKCFKIIKDINIWFPRDSEVQQIISNCLLWRFENKLEFYCGSMILNKQIIALVYSQIFNYLLILMQFRMTQEMGDQIEKQKNTIQEWIGVD